ncbi:MAG: PAC2 family protein [Nitrosopumilus sp.]|nr:PAC2 family protein [Nitrosopumilus sp.]
MQISKTSPKENTLLVGFPSNGLVGTFTISYLVHYLEMKLIGEIEHPDLPPTLFVEDGEILPPIRIYKKNNLFVVLSDLPFDPFVAYDFAESILDYCKKNQIKKIIIISGMETINRNPKPPKIFGLVTHQSLEKLLYDYGVPKFLSGSIFGTDAAMITAFRKSKIPALILYAECHPFFPDPEASIVAITTLARVLEIKVDTNDIQKRIEWLRIQHRNLMEETIRSLQQQQQEKKPGKAPQIYR